MSEARDFLRQSVLTRLKTNGTASDAPAVGTFLPARNYQNLSLFPPSNPAQPLPPSSRYCVITNDDFLLSVDNDYIFAYKKNEIGEFILETQTAIANISVNDVAIDPNGDLWILNQLGGSEAIKYQYDGDGLVTFQFSVAIPNAFGLAFANNGTECWVGDSTANIVRKFNFNGTTISDAGGADDFSFAGQTTTGETTVSISPDDSIWIYDFQVQTFYKYERSGSTYVYGGGASDYNDPVLSNNTSPRVGSIFFDLSSKGFCVVEKELSIIVYELDFVGSVISANGIGRLVDARDVVILPDGVEAYILSSDDDDTVTSSQYIASGAISGVDYRRKKLLTDVVKVLDDGTAVVRHSGARPENYIFLSDTGQGVNATPSAVFTENVRAGKYQIEMGFTAVTGFNGQQITMELLLDNLSPFYADADMEQQPYSAGSGAGTRSVVYLNQTLYVADGQAVTMSVFTDANNGSIDNSHMRLRKID